MRIPIITIEHRLNPQIQEQIEDGTMSNEEVLELFNTYSTIHNENLPYSKKLKRSTVLFTVSILIGVFVAYIMSTNTEYELFDKAIHNNLTLQLALSYICFGIIGIALIAFVVCFIAIIVYSVKAKPFSNNLLVYKDLISAIHKRDVNFFNKNGLDISNVNF